LTSRRRARIGILTVGPWEPEFGDPFDPVRLVEVDVDRIACSRVSPPGALVRLVDGRYGLTGRVVAVGPAYQLAWYLRRRRATATVEERQWLDRCIECLRADRARRDPGRPHER
jgi:potassium/hydrogen antiporter